MHPSHSLLPETPKAENMRDKASLRRHYRQLRRTTPAIHEAIYGAALSFVRRTTTETSVVGLYWPLANEVDLRSLRTQLPNPMALPQADGKGCLQYKRWSGQDLEADGCGIPAPSNGSNLQADEISLLLVPALARGFIWGPPWLWRGGLRPIARRPSLGGRSRVGCAAVELRSILPIAAGCLGCALQRLDY